MEENNKSIKVSLLEAEKRLFNKKANLEDARKLISIVQFMNQKGKKINRHPLNHFPTFKTALLIKFFNKNIL